ncbi:GntR family transcriptional regulator [Catenuloplanes nepalensis]|uniref:GntR family transcriptional regulator n=1 Tax=Catenuloplanes nepalensis TaxID=587533 RepID=A0ABT9MQQ3_9ACTN|nr:GntR family transcriptional regulator [Catenuloplanes nepalensis]
MDFHLNSRSGVSTYLQLVQQVKHAIRLGLLKPGDRLPTAAEVVAALAINPNTVLKAYRELEREGLVSARPGLGTFVERSLGDISPVVQARLRRQLAQWTDAARAAGLSHEDIEALFTTALREFTETEVA